MVVHTCPTCCKNFYKKSTYINHTVNKKNPCTPFDYTQPVNNNFIDNPIDLIHNVYQKPEYLHKKPEYLHKKPEYLHKDILNDDLEDNIDNNDDNNDDIDDNINDIDDNIMNNGNDNIKHTKHKCKFCRKYFCRKDVLKTHIDKFCKVQREVVANKEKIMELLVKKDEQIEQLLTLVTKLTETNAHNTTTDSNNTNNTNNTNNGSIATNNGSMATNNGNITTNNIKIEFGKEDLDKISNDFFIKTLLNFSGAAIPSKIIEGIHFNPELKEFMNVFITDMSRNKAMIHDGNKWNIANADEVVNTLFDRAVNFCEDRNEELKEKIEKNDKINKKINKEMYIIDIMTNNEPYEYDEHNQPIDIDGKVLKIDELKRGKRLNVKAKEHLKKNLYNKKEIIQKIK